MSGIPSNGRFLDCSSINRTFPGKRKEIIARNVQGGDMALSGKYGKVNIPNVGADEPVFILRAQDKLAEFAIEMYKTLASSHGSKVGKGIDQEIVAFREWTGKKKFPD
jgi:hypothetical protein